MDIKHWSLVLKGSKFYFKNIIWEISGWLDNPCRVVAFDKEIGDKRIIFILDNKLLKAVNDLQNAELILSTRLKDSLTAREELDTSDDFLYLIIHRKIVERIKKNNTEKDILDMVIDELDQFDKERIKKKA